MKGTPSRELIVQMRGQKNSGSSASGTANCRYGHAGRASWAKWMWSPQARGIYIAEFIILAASPVIILGYFALLLTISGGLSFLVSTRSALLGGGNEVARIAVPEVVEVISVCISVLGLMAFWIFLDLSLDYMSGRLTPVPRTRRRYWRGLFYATIPAAILGFQAFATGFSEPDSPFAMLLLSWLLLVVPATHLGVALHVSGMEGPRLDKLPS